MKPPNLECNSQVWDYSHFFFLHFNFICWWFTIVFPCSNSLYHDFWEKFARWYHAGLLCCLRMQESTRFTHTSSWVCYISKILLRLFVYLSIFLNKVLPQLLLLLLLLFIVLFVTSINKALWPVVILRCIGYYCLICNVVNTWITFINLLYLHVSFGRLKGTCTLGIRGECKRRSMVTMLAGWLPLQTFDSIGPQCGKDIHPLYIEIYGANRIASS